MTITTSQALLDAMDKAIGENDEAQSVKKFIDTGFGPLNEIMTGNVLNGLPQGRLIEVFGESSSGKTALATKWMVETQRQGGVAGFVDWERSFSVDLAENFGLTTRRPQWIYARPKTWEEGNMLATKACKFIRDNNIIDTNAPILFVFDSIASAMPKSQAEKEIDEYTMNDTTALARVTSTTLKAQAQWAAEFNATFLYLNQIRLKPGVVYGDPRTTPGGKAMEFFASVRLALGRQKIMEQVDGEKEFVGQKITIECVKSKFTKPFEKTSLRMDFDEFGAAHFDITTSLLEHLTDNKKLVVSGPRITWIDGKTYFKKALVEKINSEGLQSELQRLLIPT